MSGRQKTSWGNWIALIAIVVAFIAWPLIEQILPTSTEGRFLLATFWLILIVLIASESARRNRREKLRAIRDRTGRGAAPAAIDYVVGENVALAEAVADDENTTASMIVHMVLIAIFLGVMAAVSLIFSRPTRRDEIWFAWLCLLMLCITVMEPFYEGWGLRRKRTESKLNAVIIKLDAILERVERLERGE